MARFWSDPLFDSKYAGVSALAAIAIALILGVPTSIVENPWFTRMTPVEPEQSVFWILSSVLGGALLGTYLSPALRGDSVGPLAGSGLLGIFAIGCPTCNALVVSALGTSGALSLFAPVQPLLGAAAVAVAGWALWIRVRSIRSGCPIPPPAA